MLTNQDILRIRGDAKDRVRKWSGTKGAERIVEQSQETVNLCEMSLLQRGVSINGLDGGNDLAA